MNTPKTDAVTGEHSTFHGVQMVSADFARQLENQVQELREALEEIARPIDGTPVGNPWDFYRDLQALAQAVLERTK